LFVSFCNKLKVNGDSITTIDVPKKYIGIVMGKERRNIGKIETKSETRIKVASVQNTEGTV
jgi:predicted PilT family ATPase